MKPNEKPPKRDPREPTPLVLMNPELRVRQLRYAANIEASLMVPLHRYYEVLLDLSQMGLEYLKAMKLERAFIIFKRIEYFLFHRLLEHPGIDTFHSESKTKILARLPMIMYAAQQIVIEFVMPVYERQAAYFRYEELQRRLKILNPTAWQGVMAEAARREAEFYSEAEEISTRFGVELSSFIPMEVIPDDNHPKNFPPRTIPTKRLLPKKVQMATDKKAIEAAINTVNRGSVPLPIHEEQSVEALVRNINTLMNDALAKFFNTRTIAMTGQPLIPENTPSTSSVDITTKTNDDIILVAEVSANSRKTYSPRVDHMYQMPGNLPESQPYVPPVGIIDTQKRMAYKPKYPLEYYIDLLTKTFELNSTTAAGYCLVQETMPQTVAPSTANFFFRLVPITDPEVALKFVAPTAVIPEPDPGQPGVNPPVQPITVEADKPNSFGVWTKRGAACGPEGVGSLGVLSDLDRAREVLDAVPPMPAGTEHIGTTIPVRKRTNEDDHRGFRKRRPFPTIANVSMDSGGPCGSGIIYSYQFQQ